MAVAVVTYSTADIPSEVAKELEITVIPAYVQIGKESYSAHELDKVEFYRKLEDGYIPKASMPNLNDFVTLYSNLAQKTNEILYISVGDWYGGSHAMAVTAAKEMRETGAECHIEVIDSKSAIMGLGLLVIEAAKAAKEGMGLSRLVEMVGRLIPKVHVLCTFDTLKYLQRLGYIGKAKELLGSALRVNPLIELKEEVLPYGRARGRAKAVDALAEYASSFRPRGLAVEYGKDPGDAKSLLERLGQMFPRVPTYTSMVSPEIAAFAGPHILSVSVLEE